MMVLRHIRPPATVVSHTHSRQSEDHEDAPIDLSTKIVRISGGIGGSGGRGGGSEVSCQQIKSPLHVITPPISSHSQSPVSRLPRDETTRLLYRSGVLNSEVHWREAQLAHGRGNDEENSFSSPDSGLQRDSPGEDEDVGNKSGSPPLNSLRQNLIPLSLIRARYNNHSSGSPRADSSGASGGEESGRPGSDPTAPDHVQTKRKRLEEMVSHIKQSKPPKERPHRHSGDDDTSSGDHAISSDEIGDEGSTPNLRSLGLRLAEASAAGVNPLSLCADGFPMRSDEDEPCNLACAKGRGNNNCLENSPFDLWKMKGSSKTMQPLSPSEAAKMYSIDPETYQQQIMQLQLTSAAMMGDPGGLLKAMGNYPPWVYLGYYSQLLHSYQAQEILRQYAMQSQSSTPPVSQGEKSPSVPHTLGGSSGYNCGSPMSPASLSEGHNGMDSDGSIVGQGTSGSANGKRAPRAMTGRHVRTGTGASPSTLKTLREKIEERQRLKAQQMRQGVLVVQNYSNKGKPSKVIKKAKK